MNLPIPSAPTVVKNTLGAIGNEWGKFTNGVKNIAQQDSKIMNSYKGQPVRPMSVKGMFKRATKR